MLVIIHGWSDESGSFKPLVRRLVAAGIAQEGVEEIHLGDYLSLDDQVTFDDVATALERAWTRHNLPRGPRGVDVVVHSTGALVIRDWLTRYFEPGKAPIHRLLMLAPANFGSPLAHTGRSLIGRATKGWHGTRLFETGTHILKGLELASPYSAALAGRDQFCTESWYGPGRMLCTVLVGNTGYSGISAIANRPGSDGTVRVSTANLNCARLDADFASDPKQPDYNLTGCNGLTAFGVMDGEDHSSVACKSGGPRHNETLQTIFAALRVDDDDFEAWCDKLAVQTRQLMDKRNARGSQPYYHGYQNTVVHVQDQYGNPVPDYLIELFANDDKGRRNRRLTRQLQEEVIANVHAYSDDAARRSMLINCRQLRALLDRDDDRLNISITASPDINNHDVGFGTYSDKDIGFLSLQRKQMNALFEDNRTLLLTITLRREQSDNVFRLRPY